MQITPQMLTRHRKTGGLYRVVDLALVEATHQQVVVYRSEATGQLWVRPLDEFSDGRFEPVAEAPGAALAVAGHAARPA